MSKSFREALLLHRSLNRSYSLAAHISSISRSAALGSICERECTISYNFRKLQFLDICNEGLPRPFRQHFHRSFNTENICWEVSSQSVLLRKFEAALKDHNIGEAWEAYNDFRNLHGFPNHSLMSKLIIDMSYSSDPHWLRRACDLVLSIQKEKSDLLCPDLLIKLSLSLARAQMPVLASTIFRLMLEKLSLPTANILGLFFLHMVKTQIGTFLASNILIELCDSFQHLTTNRFASAKLIKPDTMIFNLVLDACVRFDSSFKAQQIIELMAQAGIVADAHTIVIISRIHEMNGQRDELKKFKDRVDQVLSLAPLVRHYRQFYDSLLSLHFKFNDLDSVSGLILDMYRCQVSLHGVKGGKNPQKSFFIPIGSHNLRTGLKIQILPELMQDCVLKVENKEVLIKCKNGKLVLNNKGIARLVMQYKKCGRIGDLSRILMKMQDGPLMEQNLCSDVIDACINLGWLETAHDIVDDMKLAGCSLDSCSYMSLLRAYYERHMFREAEALLKQITKAGLDVKMSDDTITLSDLEGKTTLPSGRVTSSGKSDLAKSIIWEMEEEEKAVPSVVYELNSSIYFFWKAKMEGDALKTYRKMQEMKIKPIVQTYILMVSGYSCLKMYREITILWGDIKRSIKSGILVSNRDLFEFMVLSFLRGGYFERVIEAIGYMKENNMYIDKWMFRIEFLKLHKDLYRTLKASNARNEAQSDRIGHVRAFRKFVGIH